MARFSRKPVFLRSLIRTAYFPIELPPVLTTTTFAQFCHDNFAYLDGDLNRSIKLSTKFDTYTVPRVGQGRRNLALVNPLGQLAVSLLLTKHRATIRDKISRSGTSLYETQEDPSSDHAFAGLNFRKWDALKLSLFSEYRYILSADISRFFYTIYTHSIPWSVLGKDKVKLLLSKPTTRSQLFAHWSSRLDMALQACQSRETFGLPVGPDTSRIIAEVLLSGVGANNTVREFVNNGNALRMLDDFSVGFDNEQDARNALTALRRALWSYNLQLNEEKTHIRPSSQHYREKWKLEFEDIILADSDERQREQIYGLIERALQASLENNSSAPARWACAKISRCSLTDGNFPIALESLLRLSRDVPHCTANVSEFIINNQARIRQSSLLPKVRRWIRSKLSDHQDHSHDFEMAWSLTVAAVLGLSINEDDFRTFDRIPSSVVFSIIGLLRSRGLLTFSLSRWNWRSVFRSSGLYGENWLPLCEAVGRKWTSDKSLIEIVKSDPVFDKMLAANVTFLNEDVFKFSSIDLSRRRFTRDNSLVMHNHVEVAEGISEEAADITDLYP